MVIVSSSKCLGIRFRKKDGTQENVKVRVGEGMKTFGAMNMMCNVSSVYLGNAVFFLAAVVGRNGR